MWWRPRLTGARATGTLTLGYPTGGDARGSTSTGTRRRSAAPSRYGARSARCAGTTSRSSRCWCPRHASAPVPVPLPPIDEPLRVVVREFLEVVRGERAPRCGTDVDLAGPGDARRARGRTHRSNEDAHDVARRRTGVAHRRRRSRRLDAGRSPHRRATSQRSSCSTTSPAAARRTSPWPCTHGSVRLVEGDVQGSTTRRGAHGGDRCRLPPRGDATPALRRRAPARAGGHGRRDVQRRRRGASGRCAQGRRVIVGVRVRRGRAVPDRGDASSVREPHALRHRQGLSRRVAPQLSRRVRPRLRRASLLQRVRTAHGRAQRVRRSTRAVDATHRRGPAAGDPRRRLDDDGLRRGQRHRPRQRARGRVRRHRHGREHRDRHRDQPPRARAGSPRRDGLRSRARVRAPTGDRRRTAAAGGHRPCRGRYRVPAEVGLDEGLGRLVEWWRSTGASTAQ